MKLPPPRRVIRPRNNVLTASRMNCFFRCLRQHYWRYEVGLQCVTVWPIALRFGSAWARAMEARWKGSAYEDALAYAIPEGVDLDPQACATLSAVLAAYYANWGRFDGEASIKPEAPFDHPIEEVPGWRAAGKLDGIGVIALRQAIVESKTTGDSLDPDSDYWLRLRHNTQVLQYIVAARTEGWNVQDVYYDVTRKPKIKPREVTERDENGKKIVLDSDGNRVLKKNGEPRESGDAAKGWVIQSHIESPEEYGDRLRTDCLTRPAFYFARREIPIIEDDVAAFRLRRAAVARAIDGLRANELRFPRAEQAWPQNVAKDACAFCQFASFCLQNLSVDPNHPPVNFAVQSFNPELEDHDSTEDIPTSAED